MHERGPLLGVRVIDLSTVLSGPLATVLLADQGADVIKIEAPGAGDLTRMVGSRNNDMTAMFCLANRGKRSLVLDLSGESGRTVLRRLAETADVLVQNFRPGVAERMGIGYDELRVVNPGLIYVSIAGFGFDGPLANLRVYDNLIQAVSGMAMVQGDADEPRPVQNLVCDKITALTAAQATTAALLARAGGAPGQHVRISMLDATVSFLWPDAGTAATLLSDDATVVPPRDGSSLMRHRDGWTTSAPVSDAEFRGWCRAFGAPELADDPRFATGRQRLTSPDLAAERRRVIDRASDLTVAEALERLAAEGVGAVPVLDVKDLPSHPQALCNGTFVERTHPVAGPMREPAPAARFSATPATVGVPAPLMGEHTDDVLREAGWSDSEIRDLRAAGTVG
ncbi:MAG TPA: CaiB/BaiF CoA-transferase family protein [Acidimicrobiales bacterium]|nr:CaiB/BaiF CoA-transferase family protein [Acidimicrobiales bacterium]